MSYNISSWHTKRLEQLSIPLEALTVLSQELIDRRWESPLPAAIRVDGEELAVYINFVEGEGVVGVLSGTNVIVHEICIMGEASGTAYREILRPALEKSTGILEAVLVWEGGDSITRLIVNDGEVTEQDVEL